MMNYIWLTIVILAIVLGGINGKIENVTKSAIDAASSSVTIAIGLIGTMALWLGIMKIAEDSGLLALAAKAITPILKKLFPDVPAGHPAMASMTMNIAGKYAWIGQCRHGPIGLKAMEDLETLNTHPGVATNAMCTFLTINTAGLQLVPATVIGVLASAGSKDPTVIIGTTIAATFTALIAGIATVKLLEKLPVFSVEREGKRKAL